MNFKLQSFSTPSAFDPHNNINNNIDNIDNNNNSDNNIRSTAPIFYFNSYTKVYFFAIKWDTQVSVVSSLSFPLRSLYDVPLKGEIAFYQLNTDSGSLDRIGNNIPFNLTESYINLDYITINFTGIELPASVLNNITILPIYIGIKLIDDKENANPFIIITNSHLIEQPQTPNDLPFGLTLINSAIQGLQESYNIANSTILTNIPELYVE